MKDDKREEILKIVKNFRGQAVTVEAIREFCETNKIEFVTLGDLEDYTVQYEQDLKVSKMVPEILKELTNIQYLPEFETGENRKKMQKVNDDVRIKIAKLIEEYDLRYDLVTGSLDELAGNISGLLKMSANTIFNKAISMMVYITKEKLGGDITTGKIKDFAEQMYKNKAIELDKKEKEG